MTQTVTVRTTRHDDGPAGDAADRERALWSTFGDVDDPRTDGITGDLLTDVTVRTAGAMTALQAAVRERRDSTLVATEGVHR